LRPRIRNAVIAAPPANRRPGAGVVPRPVSVIAPARRDASVAAPNSSVTDNAGKPSTPHRPPQQARRRARASAQLVATKIFASGRVIDRVVTCSSWFRTSRQPSVFAAWPAAWLYDACSIANNAFASGDADGAGCS